MKTPHLIERARRLNKWIHCTYQDLWFSPDELEQEQTNGKFCWGEVNWTLRDPKERLMQLKQKALDAEKFANDFKIRAGL